MRVYAVQCGKFRTFCGENAVSPWTKASSGLGRPQAREQHRKQQLIADL